MRQPLPFELSKDSSFYDSLGDWLGDTLYDVLPEKGFECRDEQIFMAYQIEQALKEKNWKNHQFQALQLIKQGDCDPLDVERVVGPLNAVFGSDDR